MNCTKYPPMLSRLLDGELSPRETAEVEGHVAQCASCRALMEHWKLQSTRLRSHLGRHLLGDDFVGKVLQARSQAVTETGQISGRAAGGRRLARWLPAAAAVLAAAVLLSLLSTSRSGAGYARVIDPGELEVLQSSSWVRATAGELLGPGDWLRNPVPGTPEILWGDTCRFTLEAGALAHIPASRLQPPDHLDLMNGALSSEIQAGTRDFQVRTPAGSVTASAGRFTVRVAGVALPRLEIAADRSEILSGTIRSVVEVSIRDGKARIQAAHAAMEVSAGETAGFSGDEFARTASHTMPVQASLRIVAGASSKGTLSSSLSVASEGLCMNIEAANISLKNLLQWATAAGVRGGEDTMVAGTLRVPAYSSPEAVASAVGVALGLPISFHQEKVRQSVTAGQPNPTPAPDWTKGDFAIEKAPNGLISFDFHAMPAGQVFQILRSAVPDLPELSTEAEWLPVTLRASDLSSEGAAAWVAKALGLQIGAKDQQIDMIEVGTAANGVPAVQPASRTVPPDSGIRTAPIGGGKDVATRSDIGRTPVWAEAQRSMTETDTATVSPAGPSSGLRSLWNVLGGGMTAVGFYVPMNSGNSSAVKGKTTSNTPEFFDTAGEAAKPIPSLHLIWPVVVLGDSSGDDAAYLITNQMGLPVHTLWSGYDREGRLVAQFEIIMNGSSSLEILPSRDLPANLGEGGHWETLSSIPLAGSRADAAGSGFALGLPAQSERLRREWSFPSAWLRDPGVRMWLVNPTADQATAVMGIMRGSRALATDQVPIPPHGGRIWPEAPIVNGPGVKVVFYVVQGSVASGLIR